ncbi:MAG: NAAT family transporter [Rhodospirillales bacterium]|nr:NAAT family transporter [Rhodospirillales bacterium]MCB9995364.1 NAAT family transporter [Rhodospirillales bacterium]
MLELFLSAFVSLFVIVDPFGTAAVYATLMSKAEEAEKRRVAFRAVIIAVFILIGFCLVGHFLLHYMHVSLSAFRVAGGLLLFVTAFRMIMGIHDPDELESDKSVYRDRSNIAIFPIAIPMLAGPGCMTAALMFATEARDVVEYGVVIAVIIAVQLIALASLIGAGALSRFFGPSGNGIIARIMGILLAAMAVQFVADGVKELL